MRQQCVSIITVNVFQINVNTYTINASYYYAVIQLHTECDDIRVLPFKV